MLKKPPSKKIKRNQKLSVIIIAKDEEKTIGECLQSVAWADEIIVVVDDRTVDRTAEIARGFTKKVFFKKMFKIGEQKQFALNKASSNWVLNLDADERVSRALKKEIQKKIVSDEFDGYHVFFHEYFLGVSLTPSGKGAQGCVRLFKKSWAHFTPTYIHERVIMKGKIGVLENPIIHHSHRTISQTLAKFNVYSRLEAKELFSSGGRTNWLKITLAPINAFFNHYFFLKYYRYGRHGLVRSVLAGVYYLMKHLNIWEMQVNQNKRDY